WIFLLNYGWVKTEISEIKQEISQKKASIIVAIRNEEENLPKLLSSLSHQDYPYEQFEIIIIDDHSDDGSEEIIKKFQKDHLSLQLYYYSLANYSEIQGKKSALQLGYKKANHSIILLTDGDCHIGANWIKLTLQAFEDPKVKMVLGGVKTVRPKNLVQKFQSLELLSLIASGAGSVGINLPIMSNGANLSFKKEILNKIEISQLKPELASGDDIFLMMETKKAFGADTIRFLKNPDHFVTTQAEKSWKGLINQRIRWVSKSSGYADYFLLLTSLVVLFQNLILLVLLIASCFYPPLGFTLLKIWVLKFVVDFIFLRKICAFTSRTKLLRYYPLLALIYPFFISYTAIVGQFAGFSWKGRKY
ncbi:MAG: glycosyltransferase, partial [Bacteroidales bacterium]|nr:glycosyltransferase [Bacteroidales bacterium]